MTLRNPLRPRPRPQPHARLHVIGRGHVDVDELSHPMAATHRKRAEGANAMNTDATRALMMARENSTHPPERP
jgi:hypothetical protein